MVRPAWLNIGWTNHPVPHYLYHILSLSHINYLYHILSFIKFFQKTIVPWQEVFTVSTQPMVRPAWLNVGWTNHSVPHYLYHILSFITFYLLSKLSKKIVLWQEIFTVSTQPLVRPAWLNVGRTYHSVPLYLYHISIIRITFYLLSNLSKYFLLSAFQGPDQTTAQNIL